MEYIQLEAIEVKYGRGKTAQTEVVQHGDTITFNPSRRSRQNQVLSVSLDEKCNNVTIRVSETYEGEIFRRANLNTFAGTEKRPVRVQLPEFRPLRIIRRP